MRLHPRPRPHTASRDRMVEATEDDVLVGLRAARKHLPCRLLYDTRGADLFVQICVLDDYYLTRAELALLAQHLPAIASEIGPRARVIEPGSGAGRKTRMMLSALDRPTQYVPIDVSSEQLELNAQALREEFPGLKVQPVHGDYTRPIDLPPSTASDHTVVFFPGSTIGNFEPAAARTFLARFGDLAGPGATLLLGADSNDDADALLRAYDDSEGVTAAFDLNVLTHLNHTHDADFDVAAFVHRATWDATRSRIEMHLVSQRSQQVSVRGETFAFERGEPIVTEHCYKHRPEVLRSLLGDAGWDVRHELADPEARMRLWLATRRHTRP